MTDSPPASGAEVRLPELIMHFREGCHLCEDMRQQLDELFEPGEFRLTLVDIDEDESLRQAYNVRVPVLSLVRAAGQASTSQDVSKAALRDETASSTTPDEHPGAVNCLENGSLEELCEHFLDLVAVREALASYNSPLLAACSVPADR